MTRYRLTACVLVLAVAAASAQEPKADPKPAKGWNDKDVYPSLFPELDPKKDEVMKAVTDKLPEVVVAESDSPTVKAAKRMLTALRKQYGLIGQRVGVGAFTGPTFTGRAETLNAATAAAELNWDKPEQLLPWYEWRVLMLKQTEQYLTPRVKQKLETAPDVLPQFIAERYKAEIALQKLKEKAKK